MDFTHVENLDYSCASTFIDIGEIVHRMDCQLLFVRLNEKMKGKLEQEGALDRPGIMTFGDLDYASEYVEESLLQRASFIRFH